jgi:hypothetical protein
MLINEIKQELLDVLNITDIKSHEHPCNFNNIKINNTDKITKSFSIDELYNDKENDYIKTCKYLELKIKYISRANMINYIYCKNKNKKINIKQYFPLVIKLDEFFWNISNDFMDYCSSTNPTLKYIDYYKETLDIILEYDNDINIVTKFIDDFISKKLNKKNKNKRKIDYNSNNYNLRDKDKIKRIKKN